MSSILITSTPMKGKIVSFGEGSGTKDCRDGEYVTENPMRFLLSKITPQLYFVCAYWIRTLKYSNFSKYVFLFLFSYSERN